MDFETWTRRYGGPNRRPITRPPFPWTPEMDTSMLDTMIDYSSNDEDTRTRFRFVLHIVRVALNHAFDVAITVTDIWKRLRALRYMVKYAIELMTEHGLEFDRETQRLVATRQQWLYLFSCYPNHYERVYCVQLSHYVPLLTVMQSYDIDKHLRILAYDRSL